MAREKERGSRRRGKNEESRSRGGTEVERKRRHYDVRLDFAACLRVGAYRVSILFLFVLYVNSSPVGAQGQHQSMADGG